MSRFFIGAAFSLSSGKLAMETVIKAPDEQQAQRVINRIIDSRFTGPNGREPVGMMAGLTEVSEANANKFAADRTANVGPGTTKFYGADDVERTPDELLAALRAAAEANAQCTCGQCDVQPQQDQQQQDDAPKWGGRFTNQN